MHGKDTTALEDPISFRLHQNITGMLALHWQDASVEQSLFGNGIQLSSPADRLKCEDKGCGFRVHV